MKITSIELFRLTIPMEPFVIATETCYAAENVYLRVHTNHGITGVGECSPFPMLVGETQDTCMYVGHQLAKLLIGKNPLEIEERLNELDAFIAFNKTIKSAFDMALYEPTFAALRAIESRIIPGSVIVFDELNDPRYPGESKAYRDWIGDRSHEIRRSEFLPDRTFVILK